MPFVFIGNKFTNSPPLKPEGLDYLQGNNILSDTTFIDLGSFETRIYNTNQGLITFKNFFYPVLEKNFPDSVKLAEIDKQLFLYDQDAIDFSLMQSKNIYPIFKNQRNYFFKTDTFNFIELFLEEVKTKNIIINNQQLSVKLMINDYCKNKDLSVSYVNDLLGHYCSTKKINNESNGIIIDIGFSSIKFLFIFNGLIFEYFSYEKGLSWVNKMISSSDEINSEILMKEINKEIDLNSTNGVNSLYNFFLESVISEAIEKYYNILVEKKLSNFFYKDFPVFIYGGAININNAPNIIYESLNNYLLTKNITISSEFKADSLSLLKGLTKNTANI